LRRDRRELYRSIHATLCLTALALATSGCRCNEVRPPERRDTLTAAVVGAAASLERELAAFQLVPAPESITTDLPGGMQLALVRSNELVYDNSALVAHWLARWPRNSGWDFFTVSDCGSFDLPVLQRWNVELNRGALPPDKLKGEPGSGSIHEIPAVHDRLNENAERIRQLHIESRFSFEPPLDRDTRERLEAEARAIREATAGSRRRERLDLCSAFRSLEQGPGREAAPGNQAASRRAKKAPTTRADREALAVMSKRAAEERAPALEARMRRKLGIGPEEQVDRGEMVSRWLQSQPHASLLPLDQVEARLTELREIRRRLKAQRQDSPAAQTPDLGKKGKELESELMLYFDDAFCSVCGRGVKAADCTRSLCTAREELAAYIEPDVPLSTALALANTARAAGLSTMPLAVRTPSGIRAIPLEVSMFAGVDPLEGIDQQITECADPGIFLGATARMALWRWKGGDHDPTRRHREVMVEPAPLPGKAAAVSADAIREFVAQHLKGAPLCTSAVIFIEANTSLVWRDAVDAIVALSEVTPVHDIRLWPASWSR